MGIRKRSDYGVADVTSVAEAVRACASIEVVPKRVAASRRARKQEMKANKRGWMKDER